MRRLVVAVGALAALVAGSVMAWRRNPRIGTRVVNEVINPVVLGRGISGGARSELGTIEHIGRRSGTRRLTPVHPEATDDGFRVVVPLGPKSHWARNILAAGRCRLQLRDTVYELDRPALVSPAEVDEVPKAMRWIGSPLGFQYLLLHRLAERPGPLEPTAAEHEATPEAAVEERRSDAPPLAGAAPAS